MQIVENMRLPEGYSAQDSSRNATSDRIQSY